jgi:hypothetical protein
MTLTQETLLTVIPEKEKANWNYDEIPFPLGWQRFQFDNTLCDQACGGKGALSLLKGVQNGTAIMKRSFAMSSKICMSLIYDPAICVIRI